MYDNFFLPSPHIHTKTKRKSEKTNDFHICSDYEKNEKVLILYSPFVVEEDLVLGGTDDDNNNHDNDKSAAIYLSISLRCKYSVHVYE